MEVVDVGAGERAEPGGGFLVVAACVPRGVTGSLVQRVRSALEFSMAWGGTWVDVRAAVGVAESDGRDGPSLVTAAYADMLRGTAKSPAVPH